MFAETLHLIDLDPDEQLAGDLIAPTYKYDSDSRRVVEKKVDTKKRLRRSPDRGDTAVMAFAPGAPSPAAARNVQSGGGGKLSRAEARRRARLERYGLGDEDDD